MANCDFIIENGVLKDYVGVDSNIVLPNGVISIGWTFATRDNLTRIVLPNSMTSVESYSFCGCKNLVNIILPGSINSIGDLAFDGCLNLISITLPYGISSIGYKAFNKCKELEVFIYGTPKFEEFTFSYVKKIIAPNISLSKFITSKEKRAAVKGFLSHNILYQNKEIINEYKKYIIMQKKSLLFDILSDDDVSALEIYLEIKKHHINNFSYEYLKSAEKANAKKCLEFLIEWEDKNIFTIYDLQDIKDIL